MTKRIRILILAVALIAGLALPFGVAALQDIFGTHVWQVNDDAHYEYSGTLRNRAIALNAYRNGAPTQIYGWRGQSEAAHIT